LGKFLELLLWNGFQCCQHFFFFFFFWMSSISWIFVPIRQAFSKKSFGAKLEEQSGCSISVIDFWATNCLIESILWAGALSWWKIQSLGQCWGLYAQLHITASVSPHNKLDWLMASWNELEVNNTLDSEESDKHYLHMWFWHVNFLASWVSQLFPLQMLSLALGIILKALCFILSVNFTQNLILICCSMNWPLILETRNRNTCLISYATSTQLVLMH
jgi:hypothetical protein